jgi:hypothetical protein
MGTGPIQNHKTTFSRHSGPLGGTCGMQEAVALQLIGNLQSWESVC